MPIRAEYTVEKLPDTFVRESVRYVPVYVLDEEGNEVRRPDGRKQFSHWDTVVEKLYGGYRYTFPRGHSIVLDEPPEKAEASFRKLGESQRTRGNQLELFGLNQKPRLIDEQSGEEVDERGVPLNISHLVAQPSVGNGHVSAPGTQATDGEGGGVEASIQALE